MCIRDSAIVAAAGFPDLWLFSHATTLVVRPFPVDRLPPCGVTRLGPSPFTWQPRCRADASNAVDAVGSSMAARLGLDTCRHHHDADPVLGFADATIIATGDAVATTLLKGFDAYAAAAAETIRTLDGRYVSKKHHTLLPRGENYLHTLSDHVSGLLVAASRCAAEPPLFPEAHGCVQIKFLRRVRAELSCRPPRHRRDGPHRSTKPGWPRHRREMT